MAKILTRPKGEWLLEPLAKDRKWLSLFAKPNLRALRIYRRTFERPAKDLSWSDFVRANHFLRRLSITITPTASAVIVAGSGTTLLRQSTPDSDQNEGLTELP